MFVQAYAYTFSYSVSNSVYFSMSQSTCIKCKRFISCKCPCTFCDANNSLRSSDDCVPIVATGGEPLLPLLEAAAASSANCVSPPFLSPLFDENDGMRCHFSQMSFNVSSALSAVKSFLSTLNSSHLWSTELLVLNQNLVF